MRAGQTTLNNLKHPLAININPGGLNTLTLNHKDIKHDYRNIIKPKNYFENFKSIQIKSKK